MKENNVDKILIATAFPIYGAGSGVLVNLQSAYHKLFNKEVHIVTANNRDDFPKQENIKYRVVPFKSEKSGAQTLPGSAPFNYLMFTTHTESTENFWNIGLKELEIYNKTFENTMKKEIEEYDTDVIHAQHNWLLSNLCTKFNKPVVTTVHGTDLIGYEKSRDYLADVNQKIEEYKSSKYKDAIEKFFDDEKNVTSDNIDAYKKELQSDATSDEDKNEINELIKLYEDRYRYRYYMHEAEESARNSDRIIVISDAQYDKFVKLFPYAKDRIVLAENGYDERIYHYDGEPGDRKFLEKINEKVKNGIESGDIDLGEDKEANLNKFGNIPTDSDKYGLFVGKFADFKGIDALLMAMKIYTDEMKKQGKTVSSIIVGSGKLNDNFMKLYDKLGLENVHFIGRATPNEIHELQKLSEFKFVLSRNEPFGLVVPEGAADGIPIIGANSGGIPSIMKAKENVDLSGDKIKVALGYLVKTLPDRPHNIADAEKEQLLKLDMYTADYIFNCDSEKDKESIIKNVAKDFNMTEEWAKDYLESYEKTVRIAAECATDILSEKVVFEKEKLAKYTSEAYGQNKKEEQILNIFNEAHSFHYSSK